MAKARGGLQRLIDQSSLGSADSLASLSKAEEETIAQDADLWGHIQRYPSYTDIPNHPPLEQPDRPPSPEREVAYPSQIRTDHPASEPFGHKGTGDKHQKPAPEGGKEDGARRSRMGVQNLHPLKDQADSLGGGAFAALETVARVLQEALEKQSRAEWEVTEWREKYEREWQRAAAAEERLAGASDRSGSVPVADGTPSSKSSPPKADSRSTPCSCHDQDICGRRVLRSGIVGEKDRASNGEAYDTSQAQSASRKEDGERPEGGPDGATKEWAGCSTRKAHFKLAWRSADGVETTHRHRHEIVSYERGNIANMARSNKQVALIWESPPQAVLIVRKPNSPRVSETLREVVRWLTGVKNLIVVLEPTTYQELLEGGGSGERIETWEKDEDLLCLHQRVDLVVTLGGDGTVLWASSLFKGPMPPVVSFAMGSLGFLTPFAIERYQECLSSLLEGPIYLTLRNRIQCRILQNETIKADEAHSPAHEPPFERLVLNEVALDRGMSSFLTNLECYCDGVFMTTVQGDGLIVSTPSGSTAYSLSAGGSMVHPQVPGILFTPICPHSLSFRPLILPEYVCLRVQVPVQTRGQAWASFDGRDRRQLCPGDALVLEMSHWPVPAVCQADPTQDFLNSARGNLHWNLRKMQE